MKRSEVMKKLESMGTAQNRKVYARHGVGGAMYGVSYGNLGKLRKAIKTDHRLAEELWATGNHDARVLATMIADPAAMKAGTLDAWARDLDNYVLTDAFSVLAGKTPHCRSRAEKWMKSKGEWTAAAGWNMCGMLTAHGDLPDAWFADRLGTIERGIHKAKNRVRHSMNQALISIGVRSEGLRRKATAAAKRIGKVAVDHGETGCKTPDAVAYIAKTVAHRRRRGKKKTKRT